MRARTNSEVHSFSRNLRAVFRSSSCSWLNPKSMAVSSNPLTLRQPQHALADDVLLDLRGPALDRVGPGPEECILPETAVHRPVGSLGQLRVRPLDLHGQLLQLLV